MHRLLRSSITRRVKTGSLQYISVSILLKVSPVYRLQDVADKDRQRKLYKQGGIDALFDLTLQVAGVGTYRASKFLLAAKSSVFLASLIKRLKFYLFWNFCLSL